MLRLFLNFLEKNHDGTGGFPESANLQTTFGGFPAFLVIAQKVFKPWFRKKSKNDTTPDFYETINFHQEILEKAEKILSFPSSLLPGGGDRMRRNGKLHGSDRSLEKEKDDRGWHSEERSVSLASAQNLMSYRKQDPSFSWEMWPFNKNQIGNIQQYGPPVLLGPRDGKEDTYGFCGDLYCPNCGTKSDFMLIEFQKPSADLMAAWMDIDIDEIDEDILRCPKCGQFNLEPS